MMIDFNFRMMCWFLAGFTAVAVCPAGLPAQAAEPSAVEIAAARPCKLTVDNAAEVTKLILPEDSENAFWQISWESDIWSARQKAAAAGKPIFVWGGSEGPPVTNC